MRIYIASSFSLIPKIEQTVKFLENCGHTITVRWWERLQLKKDFAPLSADVFYNLPECKFAFERDLMGIASAQALVFIADDTVRKYNGANVELGYAYGLNVKAFSIGTLENSALYYGVTRCKDMVDLAYKLSDHEQTWIFDERLNLSAKLAMRIGELLIENREQRLKIEELEKHFNGKVPVTKWPCGDGCDTASNICYDCSLNPKSGIQEAAKELMENMHKHTKIVSDIVTQNDFDSRLREYLRANSPQTMDLETSVTRYTCPNCYKYTTTYLPALEEHFKNCEDA